MTLFALAVKPFMALFIGYVAYARSRRARSRRLNA